MRTNWPSCMVCAPLFILAVVLAGCGAGEHNERNLESEMSRIEGRVYYRERMMLRPGSVVEVQLQDISRADAPASILASVMMTPTGGPPYDFAIDYDPASLDSRMRYALRATISMDDRLLFTSNEYIDPFSGNPVEVLVQRVPEPVRRDGPALEGAVWILQTLAGEPAPLGAGGNPVELQLLAEEEMRAAGFSGCNRYSGAYTREGASPHGTPLKFGLMAVTSMACAEGGELERAYLQMLARVDAFRLQDDTLSLLAGAETLATFRAR